MQFFHHLLYSENSLRLERSNLIFRRDAECLHEIFLWILELCGVKITYVIIQYHFF
jgi:hypothetical protein